MRSCLVAAQDRGLVILGGGGHRVEILPRLWASYDRGIAGGMYLHDLVYGWRPDGDLRNSHRYAPSYHFSASSRRKFQWRLSSGKRPQTIGCGGGRFRRGCDGRPGVESLGAVVAHAAHRLFEERAARWRPMPISRSLSRRAFKTAGYVDGQNVKMDVRWAGGRH